MNANITFCPKQAILLVSVLTVNLFAFQRAKICKSFVFRVDPLILFYELVRGTDQEITNKQTVILSGPAWEAGKSTNE